MSEQDGASPEEIMWEGRFITAKRRGRWEYVGRARGIHAAVILAVDEAADGRHVLLVDQYRVPLGRRCIELPAGLVGDHDEGEEAVLAATRELEEETGYLPGRMEALGEFYSSPGMVSESFTLFRAHDLMKTGDGGGVEGEDIRVHRVPLDRIHDRIAAWRTEGFAIDVKLLLLLGAGIVG
ncbi:MULTISPECIES: NUDIX hydrolase [Sphingobium]|uniref:GDP-mannose pyrophosphatase n=1 Tax=Sphingobium fuliginis (strain ATCC 27551) TaxID=336203 RepID=A0ABQ1ENX2_SPHSA|nr:MULTISPECIES: NUDIX hydrolase [Sphingobium]OAP32568.1 NUDIX hydrolase [Sphingobium sp. 20006FA]AJR26035.1 NUDIX hydrolase [Sphingobium sp. YBL2]KXU29438.1 NUDIX hydrolase [Sphingobium sp. AM]KYC33384.1 NUDIX hydrolase [Sphingobium sp. 22B]RYM00766.1 NUDIX hydrolase [Sphingobium fuliginis]